MPSKKQNFGFWGKQRKSSVPDVAPSLPVLAWKVRAVFQAAPPSPEDRAVAAAIKARVLARQKESI